MTRNKKWLIDTNILIDYLRGHNGAIEFIQESLNLSICFISPITVAELYAGVREGKERNVMDQFLGVFEVVVIDNELGKKGGLWRRDYGKSHGIGLADAIIAATTEKCEARLATLNKKHYPMLEDVYVPY